MTEDARKQLHEHLARRRSQWQERSPDMCGPDGFGSSQGPAAMPLTAEFWSKAAIGIVLLSTVPTILTLLVIFCCGQRIINLAVAIIGVGCVLGAVGMAAVAANALVRIMETRSYLICSAEAPHSHTHADHTHDDDSGDHGHPHPHSHTHTHADGLTHSHTHTDHNHTHPQ